MEYDRVISLSFIIPFYRYILQSYRSESDNSAFFATCDLSESADFRSFYTIYFIYDRVISFWLYFNPFLITLLALNCNSQLESSNYLIADFISSLGLFKGANLLAPSLERYMSFSVLSTIS